MSCRVAVEGSEGAAEGLRGAVEGSKGALEVLSIWLRGPLLVRSFVPNYAVPHSVKLVNYAAIVRLKI